MKTKVVLVVATLLLSCLCCWCQERSYPVGGGGWRSADEEKAAIEADKKEKATGIEVKLDYIWEKPNKLKTTFAVDESIPIRGHITGLTKEKFKGREVWAATAENARGPYMMVGKKFVVDPADLEKNSPNPVVNFHANLTIHKPGTWFLEVGVIDPKTRLWVSHTTHVLTIK